MKQESDSKADDNDALLVIRRGTFEATYLWNVTLDRHSTRLRDADSGVVFILAHAKRTTPPQPSSYETFKFLSRQTRALVLTAKHSTACHVCTLTSQRRASRHVLQVDEGREQIPGVHITETMLACVYDDQVVLHADQPLRRCYLCEVRAGRLVQVTVGDERKAGFRKRNFYRRSPNGESTIGFVCFVAHFRVQPTTTSSKPIELTTLPPKCRRQR